MDRSICDKPEEANLGVPPHLFHSFRYTAAGLACQEKSASVIKICSPQLESPGRNVSFHRAELKATRIGVLTRHINREAGAPDDPLPGQLFSEGAQALQNPPLGTPGKMPRLKAVRSSEGAPGKHFRCSLSITCEFMNMHEPPSFSHTLHLSPSENLIPLVQTVS